MSEPQSVCPHCGASEEGRSMFANWTCDSWLSTAGEVWQSPACTIRVAKAEIERLTRERDEARVLARRWWFSQLPYDRIRAIEQHPWLKEREGEG